MNSRWKRLYSSELFMTLMSLGIVVAAWELLVDFFKVPKWLLPGPSAILVEMYASKGYLWNHTLVTIKEVFVGFALAVLVGILLGIIIAYSPILEKTLYKLLVATQSIPKVAIAPLLVLWLGLGLLTKVTMVFLMCFFPIMVSMVSGLQSTHRELLELADVLGANWVQSFLKIRFPAALPYLFNGLKVSVSLAVVGAVISEFINADKGLGYSLLISTSQMNGPLAFSVLTILAALGIGLFSIVARLEKMICPWAK
ncbi:ABC transporter permease [Desulfosporosinus sp. Sb-LF]|uniref:ABC transporter permease n=1 Tax=Desulfosporosinus sp. Sb-LF TaxID=2560027 RepID=UPI0018EE4FE3|nr:ABC transporter permease [Desulfosporosinus sp. Sb-LF]